MGTPPAEPAKPDLEKEVARLQRENEELRVTTRRLRGELEKLAERQRELAREHAALENTFKRLTGKTRP